MLLSMLSTCALVLFSRRGANTLEILMSVCVMISNSGYFILSCSRNVQEALLANTLAYVGGIFLPLLIVYILIDYSDSKVPTWFSIVILVINDKDVIAKRVGEEIVVKYILDIRDFPESRFASLVTHNADDVFTDKDIKIAVETIGGARIAYEYTKRALSSGISVVTSNKELVSTKGPELLEIAKNNNCCYLFEAAVGGGIPIIRPLYKCLAANKITKIAGIVNGTTNYILSQMKDEGLDFVTALKQAQENGFAEANPSADIDGIDAQRKLSILSTIANDGEYIAPEKISAEGISAITTDDMAFATSIGCDIKLIALYEAGEKPIAYVAPALVEKSNLLYNVNGVFNAIMVDGNSLGQAMFYGRPRSSSLQTRRVQFL